MQKSQKIRSEYDKSALTYNSRYSKIQQAKYQKALQEMELTGRILDLGSGTGLLREFLKIDIIGADISLNMLTQGSGGAVQAQAEVLPFKDRIFDYVLSFSALMNFEDPEQALKEVKRVLKKNGVFICSYLKKFDFDKLLKKNFKLVEKRDCGEDVCYFLKKKAL